ncbi:hypothetical protein [Candidatus Uabimicrobium sp. HlEnr_7]|uniref:hypothetical protein n=1 Tax=Candidatus Uabimicrobium helgolandensis TaxID=3095367 RepID=UPI0035561080
MYKHLLILATVVHIILAHEVTIDTISYYSVNEEKFFCATIEIKGIEVEAIADMDIVVEDKSGQTYAHFLSPYTAESSSEEHTLKNIYWYGRFVGEGKISLDVMLRSFFAKEIFHSFATTLKLPKNVDTQQDIPKRWAMARNLTYRKYLRQQRDEFIEHSLINSAQRFGIPVEVAPYLLSGQSQEVLYDIEDTKTININDVEGLQVKNGGSDNSNVPTFLMTNIVPKDYYFLHFTSAKGIFGLTNKLSKCEDPLVTQLTATGRSSDFFEKMLKTLAITFDKDSEDSGGGFGQSLVDWVVADVGLVGSDFLFSEGSSYAIIVHVKSQFLLNFQLKKYFAKAVKQGAMSFTKRFKGIAYRKITNRDKSINSHSCYVQNFLVLSNSENMIKKIIATTPDKSLTSTNDFKNCRAIFKAVPEKEQAFAYVSRDYLHKINSPRYAISHYRRTMCMQNLRFLHYESLEHYSSYKEFPGSLEIPANMYCASGGKYTQSKTKPMCSVHNHLSYLTPVDETTPKTISKNEQDAYTKFRKSFYGQENELLSPIAIQIRKADNLNVRVFSPAASYTLFKDLPKYLTRSNEKILKTYLPNVFFSTNLSCNLDKIIENRKVKKYLQQMRIPHLHSLLPNLGKELSLYLCDGDLLFVPQLNRDVDITTLLPAFAALPFYSTITINDASEVQRKLDTIIRDIKKYQSIDNEIDLRVIKEQHNEQMYYAFQLKYRSLQYSLFLRVQENFIVVSNKQDIIISFVEEKVESFMAKANNFEVFFSANKMAKIRSHMKWDDSLLKECAINMNMLEIIARFFPEKKLANIKDKMYGYTEIVCPQEGKYARDFYRFKCDIHGTNLLPQRRMPSSSVKTAWPDTYANLNFTDQGFMLEIHLQGAKIE